MKTKKKIIPIVALCCVLVLSLGFLSSCREEKKPRLLDGSGSFGNYFALFGRDSRFVVEYDYEDILNPGFYDGGKGYIEVKDKDALYIKFGDDGYANEWTVFEYSWDSICGIHSPFAIQTFQYRYRTIDLDTRPKEDVIHLGRDCVRYSSDRSEMIVDKEYDCVLYFYVKYPTNGRTIRLEVTKFIEL